MIRQVKIEKLWGRYNIDWRPHPDVNILAGANGSGKSALLRILYTALAGGRDADARLPRLQALRITGERIDLRWPPDGGSDGTNDCACDFVGTFDEIAGEQKALARELSPLAADLDAAVFDTRRRSLNGYRLQATENPDAGQRIGHRLRQWVATVNTFFAPAQKTFVIQGSDVFLTQATGEKRALHELSAGEKQLLLILIRALTQDEKPFITLLDEPEISLDIDWQYRLVDTLRQLNPAGQLIIATHSPAIFGDGWNDKLFFMDELLTL